MLVQNSLQSKYNDLEVKGELVPGNTGSFEIILNKGGQQKLVHSKLNGEGVVNQGNLDKFLASFDAVYKSL